MHTEMRLKKGKWLGASKKYAILAVGRTDHLEQLSC
jgi:hypothetical protein